MNPIVKDKRGFRVLKANLIAFLAYFLVFVVATNIFSNDQQLISLYVQASYLQAIINVILCIVFLSRKDYSESLLCLFCACFTPFIAPAIYYASATSGLYGNISL